MQQVFARTGVVAIVLAILIGPYFSHPSYSSISNTTSELGGQFMQGAWIMNTGFFLFGTGTALASLLYFRQAPLRSAFTALFGLGLIGSALMSTGTPSFGNPVNPHEDWWHSFFATALGFAFALACAVALFGPKGRSSDLLSWAGLLASVVLPLAMLQFPEFDGALQRLMFAVSFVWVWRRFSPLAPNGSDQAP